MSLLAGRFGLKIILPTDYGFDILSSASGVTEMLSLSTGQKLELLEVMDTLEDDIRILAWTRNNHFRGRLLHLQVGSMHPERVLKEVEYDPEGKKRISIMV